MRKPLHGQRKVAPQTGSAFDFIHIDVACPDPQCGKKNSQRLAELVANDTTTCAYCGAIIDLATEGWRSRLAEESEIFKKIKPPTRA